MHDELPAYRALEARTAHEREELLVERPVQRVDAHSAHSPEDADDLPEDADVRRVEGL